MKIPRAEELEAHSQYVLAEGTKGLWYGTFGALVLQTYLKYGQPAKYKVMNPSVRAAIIICPAITVSALWADLGSVEFDKRMYSSIYSEQKVLKEYQDWKALSASGKTLQVLDDHKNKVIATTWAGSLYYFKAKIFGKSSHIPQPQRWAKFQTLAAGSTVGAVALALGLYVAEGSRRKAHAELLAKAPSQEEIDRLQQEHDLEQYFSATKK